MKRKIFSITFLSLFIGFSFSQEKTEKDIEEVIILKTPTQPTKRVDDKLYTGTEITLKGIESLGIIANSNVFSILNIIPSVSTTTTDAYGLGQNIMRIRGVRSMFTGMTMEGVPNYGLSPVGAREDIYDKENFASIALYKGAVPADVFSGSGNRGGSIDLSYRRSDKKMGLDVGQSFGSQNYKRTFVRFDTGEFQSGESKTSVYASFSFTDADKWKGFGKLATRKNFSFGLTHELNPQLKLELFTTYNDVFRHAFRSFNYAEITNFNNYNINFVETQKNILANDRYYYDYNNGNYKNVNSMLSLQYKPNENHQFSFKPYYAKEDALYYQTTGNLTAPNRNDITRDFWQAGFIIDYKGTYRNFNYAIGYWYEASDNQGATVTNKITTTRLVPQGQNIYVDVHGLEHLHNPFVKFAANFGNFKAQAGLKYMAYRTPGSTRYLPSATNPFVRAAQPTADLATETRLNDAFLPTIGLGYEFSKNLEAYVNYGKGYMRQYGGVTTPYLNNRAKFLAKGYTLQKLLDDWKTETSDNFDVGFIFNSKKVRLNASAFYSKQYNVLTTVNNPIVNVNYSQSVGNLSSYGAELESYFQIIKGLTFFANPSYTQFSYDNDLVVASGNTSATIKIKGKQSPAVPKFMFKTGLLFEKKCFFANAFANHTGARYGDATNLERVPDYTLFDASAGLKFKFFDQNISFSAEVKNITDKKYVGMITFGDEQQNGGTGYFTGFPRTFVGTVKIDF